MRETAKTAKKDRERGEEEIRNSLYHSQALHKILLTNTIINR